MDKTVCILDLEAVVTEKTFLYLLTLQQSVEGNIHPSVEYLVLVFGQKSTSQSQDDHYSMLQSVLPPSPLTSAVWTHLVKPSQRVGHLANPAIDCIADIQLVHPTTY